MTEEMTIDERRKYVKLMKPRYQAADRAERSRLLSEMEQVTKLHRKSLTRLLHAKSRACSSSSAFFLTQPAPLIPPNVYAQLVGMLLRERHPLPGDRRSG
jgi:hypothetical protein